MIAKAKSISHGAQGIDYAINKEEAEVVDKRNIVGDNGREIKNEFKMYQDLNSRCEKNDISIVISPEPKDGQQLSNKDYREIADEFMQKMDLENHQAIVIKHEDKEHTHLHIFANRINENGDAYNDTFISKKSQRVADEIAQQRELVRASQVAKLKKQETLKVRNEIYDKHKESLGRPHFENKGVKSFEEYKNYMAKHDIEIKETINKANKVQGFRVSYKGHNFKASEVNRAMSYNKLKENIAINNSIMKKRESLKQQEETKKALRDRAKNIEQRSNDLIQKMEARIAREIEQEKAQQRNKSKEQKQSNTRKRGMGL